LDVEAQLGRLDQRQALAYPLTEHGIYLETIVNNLDSDRHHEVVTKLMATYEAPKLREAIDPLARVEAA